MMNDNFIAGLTEIVRKIAQEEAAKMIEEVVPVLIQRITVPGQKLSDLVDYQQAIEMLGISKPTLHKYIKEGRLTKHTLTSGGKPFLSRTELEKMLIATRKVSPTLTLKNYKRSA